MPQGAAELAVFHIPGQLGVNPTRVRGNVWGNVPRTVMRCAATALRPWWAAVALLCSSRYRPFERRPVQRRVTRAAAQVVCPPPCPRQAWWPTSTSPAPRVCPLGQRLGGCV